MARRFRDVSLQLFMTENVPGRGYRVSLDGTLGASASASLVIVLRGSIAYCKQNTRYLSRSKGERQLRHGFLFGRCEAILARVRQVHIDHAAEFLVSNAFCFSPACLSISISERMEKYIEARAAINLPLIRDIPRGACAGTRRGGRLKSNRRRRRCFQNDFSDAMNKSSSGALLFARLPASSLPEWGERITNIESYWPFVT